MKFSKLMLSALAILGLTASGAQARHYHRYHGPRVSFGFNVGRPVYRPVYVAPCYSCRPVLVTPVVYTPCVRPSFGVSFGSGPVSFGFGF